MAELNAITRLVRIYLCAFLLMQVLSSRPGTEARRKQQLRDIFY